MCPAIDAYRTILQRKEKKLYVSLWYIMGTLLWLPMLYSVGNVIWQPITDTLAGHVDGIVMDLPPLYPLIQEGKLTALAVTSEKRFDLLSNVPTAREELPGFNVTNTRAFIASSSSFWNSMNASPGSSA